jgi:hypothetical protein
MQRTRMARTRREHTTDVAPHRYAGAPLDGGARAALEPRFGHDLSRVRIHADAEADHLAQEFGAAAFTTGEDIFFRQGAYAPDTADGQYLLAHELTHVAQALLAPTRALSSHQQRGTTVSTQSDAAEVEAHAAAGQALLGQSVQVTATPSAVVAREEEGHHKGGWMDHLFGLNPDRSFVEAGLDPLFGQDGFLKPQAGEGTGTTLLKAGGSVLSLPYVALAAIGGHGLDEINHGPSLLHGAFDW